MKLKKIIFIIGFLGNFNGAWAVNKPLSVEHAKKVFLERLNEAKEDANAAIEQKTDVARQNFAQKWINHCDIKEMARQALAAVILDRIDKHDGDNTKAEQEIMDIFDVFTTKFKKHMINQYSSESRIKTFTDIDFKILGAEQISPDVVQLKVLFHPKQSSETQEFSITFDLVKKSGNVLIAGLIVEGSFDPIRNEREQVKSAYDQQNQNLKRMVSAY
jgi:hypothetical protein